MHLFPAPLGALLAPVHVPGDVGLNLHIILRLVHYVAGITWVGVGYFLVLVGMKWQRGLDPAVRAKAAPAVLLGAMNLYRWTSIITVFVGLWIWMTEIGADRRAAGVEHSSAVWSFFLLWTLAYVIYMGVLMAPAEALHKGPVLAVITAVLVIVAGYLFLRLNNHGWETNRVLAIGIGGGIGWFMMFNLWGLIWRFQKKLISWMAAGTMPPEAARMARLSALAAQTNAWLSLPMLFFMAVASHYPLFGAMGF